MCNKNLEEFNPCPLCGKTNGLRVSSKESYAVRFLENGGACISVRCWKCGLELSVYDHHFAMEDRTNYEKLLSVLRERWNRLTVQPKTETLEDSAEKEELEDEAI